MFCDAYNKPLIDAAASGAPLSRALQQHLASCDSCHAAFAEEQSLFAAIDAGLRASANPEVPATLIPRVHVALNNEAGPRRLSLSIWGFAGAAVTAVIIFSLLYLPSRNPSNSADSARVSSPLIVAPTNSAAPTTVNSSRPGGVSPLQHGKRATFTEIRASSERLPEVIVAADEAAVLLRYEEFLRKKSETGIQIASAKSLDMSQGIKPLEIAELELGDLKIPALPKPVSDGQAK